MARKIIFNSTGPIKVEEAGKYICACGLSKGWSENPVKPFCDGSHKVARSEEENKLYEYDGNGNIIGCTDL